MLRDMPDRVQLQPLASRAPGADTVRSALARLLAMAELRLSQRNRRFLAYVVEETLSGRADRVKAYTIGVDVFERGNDFDPGSDPIVRIEATRLRAALSAFYAGAGHDDPVRILLPPGGYVPQFEWAPPAAPSAAGFADRDRAPDPSTPAVIIRDRNSGSDNIERATLLMDAAAVRLAEAGYSVFLLPSDGRRAALAIEELLGRTTSVRALEIGVHSLVEGHRYSWTLVDQRSGKIIRCGFCDRVEIGAPDGQVIDELAARAVAEVVAAAT